MKSFEFYSRRRILSLQQEQKWMKSGECPRIIKEGNRKKWCEGQKSILSTQTRTKMNEIKRISRDNERRK